MLNVYSTGCTNERQLFAKLSHSAVNNILTSLLPAGSHDFFQLLYVSKVTTMVDKLFECNPDRIVHWVLSLGYLLPIFFNLQNTN